MAKMTVEVEGCSRCPFRRERRAEPYPFLDPWCLILNRLIERLDKAPENCPLRRGPVTVKLKEKT